MHQFPPEPQAPDEEPLGNLDGTDEDYEREETSVDDPETWVEFLGAADDTTDEDVLHGTKPRPKPKKAGAAPAKQPAAKKQKPARKLKPAAKKKAATKPKVKVKPAQNKKVVQKRKAAPKKLKVPKRKPAALPKA